MYPRMRYATPSSGGTTQLEHNNGVADDDIGFCIVIGARSYSRRHWLCRESTKVQLTNRIRRALLQWPWVVVAEASMILLRQKYALGSPTTPS